MLSGPTSVVPFGARSEILTLQHVGATRRLTRCPAVPSKVTWAFCPGTLVVTVTDEPPGTIAALASAGTS
jgi:hypothetical protein